MFAFLCTVSTQNSYLNASGKYSPPKLKLDFQSKSGFK